MLWVAGQGQKYALCHVAAVCDKGACGGSQAVGCRGFVQGSASLAQALQAPHRYWHTQWQPHATHAMLPVDGLALCCCW